MTGRGEPGAGQERTRPGFVEHSEQLEGHGRRGKLLKAWAGGSQDGFTWSRRPFWLQDGQYSVAVKLERVVA